MPRNIYGIAQKLLGEPVDKLALTRTIAATAASDSAQGEVDLIIGGEAVPVACTPVVHAGDVVQVTVVGRRAYVLGNPGSGDDLNDDLANLEDYMKDEAEEARKVLAEYNEALNERIDQASDYIDSIKDDLEKHECKMDFENEDSELSLYLSHSAAEMKSELEATISETEDRFSSSLTQTATEIRAEVGAEISGIGDSITSLEVRATGIEAQIEQMPSASDVQDAMKYATNYLSYTTSGLVVGNMTASSLGANVRIVTNGVQIRSGDTNLAQFIYSATNGGRTQITSAYGDIELTASNLTHNEGYIYGRHILYSNASGSQAATLSQSAANFEYIDIHFKNNNGYYGSTSVWSPNGKTFSLVTAYAGSSGSQPQVNFKAIMVQVSGTSVRVTAQAEHGVLLQQYSSGTAIQQKTDILETGVYGFIDCYITSVEGYK